jgi:hypothetical protein
MCKFKTLHDCLFGVVFQCKKCQALTVCFGNVSLTLSPDEFGQLGRNAETCLRYYEPRVEGPTIKQIPFWRLNEYATIILCINDLKQLISLFEHAQASMALSELTSEFPFCQS